LDSSVVITDETGVIRIDDIVAALVMSLAMMRRLEVLGTRREDNGHVGQGEFEQWRAQALRAYNTVALSCFGKVLLSVAWFFFVRQMPTLQIGGFLIFAGWILSLVHGWRLATEAGALRKNLGIERHRPRDAR
jgi:hypothetical protein